MTGRATAIGVSGADAPTVATGAQARPWKEALARLVPVPTVTKLLTVVVEGSVPPAPELSVSSEICVAYVLVPVPLVM